MSKRCWILVAVAFAVLTVGAAKAQEAKKPLTPTEQFESLMKEVQKAQEDAMSAYRGAKTDQERQEIIDNLSKKPQAYAARFLDLAQNHPKERFALDALAFIAVNVRSGPELDKAIDTLLKDHLDQLEPLCGALAGSQSPGAEKLLRGILEKSTSHNMQGVATLALAQLFKGMSDSGELKPDEAGRRAKDAEQYFDRVVKNFADVEGLADQAKGDLFELRHLAIGRTAPDIAGTDGDGKELKLSDYRGKVVVLDFWASWCGPCMAMVPHERELVKRLEGKPFVFLGVNADENREDLKKTRESNRMSWRSFIDGRLGPISRERNIKYFPTVFVLDDKGVIRYKGVRGRAMDEAVERLLGEMSKKQ